MEDTVGALAYIVVGGGPGTDVSTEYGSGVSPSGFADQVGNSPYHAATDFESSIGTFINGACGATCLNMTFNGVSTGGLNAGACSVIHNGHCHDRGSAGMIDDQAAIDNICATVTGGNLKYLQAERPVFSGRFGVGFLNSQTITMGINTNANLYSHTSDGCANAKIVDIETSYGEGGPGDVTGGYRVRLAALAWRWLVANPATGIPDRVVSDQLTEGETKTEVPYFFEDTLVPAGAEVLRSEVRVERQRADRRRRLPVNQRRPRRCGRAARAVRRLGGNLLPAVRASLHQRSRQRHDGGLLQYQHHQREHRQQLVQSRSDLVVSIRARFERRRDDVGAVSRRFGRFDRHAHVHEQNLLYGQQRPFGAS